MSAGRRPRVHGEHVAIDLLGLVEQPYSPERVTAQCQDFRIIRCQINQEIRFFTSLGELGHLQQRPKQATGSYRELVWAGVGLRLVENGDGLPVPLVIKEQISQLNTRLAPRGGRRRLGIDHHRDRHPSRDQADQRMSDASHTILQGPLCPNRQGRASRIQGIWSSQASENSRTGDEASEP